MPLFSHPFTQTTGAEQGEYTVSSPLAPQNRAAVSFELFTNTCLRSHSHLPKLQAAGKKAKEDRASRHNPNQTDEQRERLGKLDVSIELFLGEWMQHGIAAVLFELFTNTCLRSHIHLPKLQASNTKQKIEREANADKSQALATSLGGTEKTDDEIGADIITMFEELPDVWNTVLDKDSHLIACTMGQDDKLDASSEALAFGGARGNQRLPFDNSSVTGKQFLANGFFLTPIYRTTKPYNNYRFEKFCQILTHDHPGCLHRNKGGEKHNHMDVNGNIIRNNDSMRMTAMVMRKGGSPLTLKRNFVRSDTNCTDELPECLLPIRTKLRTAWFGNP